MALAKILQQVVFTLPEESSFKKRRSNAQKADFKNGDHSVWWMSPVGDMERPETAWFWRQSDGSFGPEVKSELGKNWGKRHQRSTNDKYRHRIGGAPAPPGAFGP